MRIVGVVCRVISQFQQGLEACACRKTHSLSLRKLDEIMSYKPDARDVVRAQFHKPLGFNLPESVSSDFPWRRIVQLDLIGDFDCDWHSEKRMSGLTAKLQIILHTREVQYSYISKTM